MRQAIASARRGDTHPNPRVGAVIVRRGEAVGRGYHRRPGDPHAEAVALARAGRRARGGTLYVNLEPCRHHGRTPPCTEAIIAAGIARVVVATQDPDRRMRTRGLAALREAGVAVTVGVEVERARALNTAYFHFQAHHRPWIVVKVATTLDGSIATRRGESQWLTGERARRQAHRLRAAADCVVVGAETVRQDDPQLTVRGVGGRSPRRVVISQSLALGRRRRLLEPNAPPVTVACSPAGARTPRAQSLKALGVDLLPIRKRGRNLDLEALFKALQQHYGALSVLVEGGGMVVGQCLKLGLCDRFHAFIAPLLLGGGHRSVAPGLGSRRLADALLLEELAVRRLGPDLWVSGAPRRQSARRR